MLQFDDKNLNDLTDEQLISTDEVRVLIQLGATEYDVKRAAGIRNEFSERSPGEANQLPGLLAFHYFTEQYFPDDPGDHYEQFVVDKIVEVHNYYSDQRARTGLSVPTVSDALEHASDMSSTGALPQLLGNEDFNGTPYEALLCILRTKDAPRSKHQPSEEAPHVSKKSSPAVYDSGELNLASVLDVSDALQRLEVRASQLSTWIIHHTLSKEMVNELADLKDLGHDPAQVLSEVSEETPFEVVALRYRHRGASEKP